MGGTSHFGGTPYTHNNTGARSNEGTFVVGAVPDFRVSRGGLAGNVCVDEVSSSVAACSVEVERPGERPIVDGTTVRAVRRLFTACIHGARFNSGVVCFNPVNYHAKFCFLAHSLSSNCSVGLVGRTFRFVTSC